MIVGTMVEIRVKDIAGKKITVVVIIRAKVILGGTVVETRTGIGHGLRIDEMKSRRDKGLTVTVLKTM